MRLNFPSSICNKICFGVFRILKKIIIKKYVSLDGQENMKRVVLNIIDHEK